ncbi:hypothetical protein EV652_109295 [Kribbella steppae]|uniref:4-amino-4-deoxy-L-arabinose transferase-like glycosyltransferase n=1 Tax=Kribbella steppae TaxID=2512223 RepID=A0A4R2H963_9ACTN|nr:hypothetical protein [Kribbella steppae]TCO23468.1 hypothetical protein EV652_109295 [Kribbella steppae]
MKSLAGRSTLRRQTVLLLGVIAVAGGLAAWWILTAGRAANEGFDITDEGYYLLSYRWWDQNPLALTGVQYLYGPIFEWLGYDVVRLRFFRLLTVVVVHLLFGYSFMRWLRGRRPGAPPTKLWELAGIATILAAGGMCYSWLPMSPGYNDVILLGALTLVACVLWMATAVDRGTPVPFWVLIVVGLVIGMMVLAKWTSVVVIGLIVIAALIVLSGQGLQAVARGIGFALAGMGVTALVVQLFVVRLNVAVPGIITVNRFIAETSYSPSALLHVYWSTGLELLGTTLRQHALLLIAAAVAVIGRWPWLRIVAAVLAVAGFVLSVRRVVVDDAAIGGSAHTSDYTVTLLAAVLVALVTALAAVLAGRYGLTPRSALSREKARGWVVLGLLVVLPLVQAFGTNNPLYTIGFNAFAAWAAVMIAVLTGIWAVPVVARVTVGVVTVASLVAVASVSYSGMFLHPYRSVGHAELTEPATLPPLKGVYVQPSAARNYAALEAELRPYLQPTARPILAFDKMAGLVLMLQGKPVGEAWVAPKERNRTAAGIEEVCRHGQPWSPGRPPIILLNRRISDVEIAALGACALDFTADYELLAPPQKTMNLQVFVPRNERAIKTP